MSLRILHVTPYFEEAWGYGGIPRIAGTLARELQRRGHRVTVCTTDVADADRRAVGVPPPGLPGDLEVRVFPNVSNRLAFHAQCFLPRGLHTYLMNHADGFDVAHLHACRNLPVSMAAYHLRRAGVPYVLAPNGTAPVLERRRLAKWIYDRTVGRGDLEGAAGVVAVTGIERAQLEALGVPASRLRLVPNPVELGAVTGPAVTGRFRERHGLDEHPLVVCVGKLTPRKRVDVLIRAVAGLDDDVRLAIVGNDMGSRAGLERLVAALGLGGRVVFTGLLRGRDRLDAMADADVVAHPAAAEIFGLAPLEALLMGAPVVVANDSGAGEIVSSTGGGLVVREGDAGAFEEAIRRILSARLDWRRRAREAAEHVRARFGGPIVAAQLDALYHEIVAAH